MVVLILKNCYVGAGTMIKENVFINEKNLIGMGSLILKSINVRNSVFFGIPVKIIKKK